MLVVVNVVVVIVLAITDCGFFDGAVVEVGLYLKKK
jgi:hypothetical protein